MEDMEGIMEDKGQNGVSKRRNDRYEGRMENMKDKGMKGRM